MAQYTSNYGLSMPDATDDFSDFRESYNENMEIIDNNLGGGSGSANQNIAENYDDTLTYSVGDYVIYNGLLYKCDTAVATAETFDPTKWTHVVVTDEMGSGGGSGGHTIVDENGSTMPTETALQFTGNVSVSDDNVNGRTVVDILGGGGSTFGFAIDENNKLFEGTINNFNQSLSYTATEDGIALCWYKGSVGMWQFLLVNGVMLRLGGDGTNTPVSYSIPIRKGDTVSARYQSGSESCYFWLSVYGIKQGTNGIFTPVIYSDTERKIGIWRDNKPLYQRTFTYDTAQSYGSVVFSTGLTDVDEVASFEGVASYASSGVNNKWLPFVFSNDSNGTGTGNAILKINSFLKSTGEIYAYIGADYQSTYAINRVRITLRYTKTTDVAGSGNWNTDGVPTIHYSTSEQVIGTWIDSKPLYQKTFTATLNNITSGVPTNVADVTSLNIDEIANISGRVNYYNGADWFNVNLGTYFGAYIYPNAYLQFLQTITGQTTNRSYKVAITVQYTKTTD